MGRRGIDKLAFVGFYLVILALLYAFMGDLSEGDINHNIKEASLSPEDGSAYDILIDLTESMLYLFKENKLINKYPVAQGKDDSPSPIGVWRITSKARNWGTGFGSRWMGLDVPWGIYGIHGTNKPYSIGQRASGGCFRMHNVDVEEIYSLVPYMTRVYVYGGPYKNLGSYMEILEPGDRQSHVLEVQLRLKTKGFYDGDIDGVYGEGMKKALLEFKKSVGLPYDHYVDEATYEALGILQFE